MTRAALTWPPQGLRCTSRLCGTARCLYTAAFSVCGRLFNVLFGLTAQPGCSCLLDVALAGTALSVPSGLNWRWCVALLETHRAQLLACLMANTPLVKTLCGVELWSCMHSCPRGQLSTSAGMCRHVLSNVVLLQLEKV